MIDLFLIIITIILGLLLIFANFYILALYTHTEDKGWGAALYCKVLVIVGMTLSWSQVLLLPLDIANSGNGIELDMNAFWYVIMLSILVMITVLLPFAMFMYETDEDEKTSSRITSAICYTSIQVVVVVLLLMISWIFFRYADIPVEKVSSSLFLPSTQVVGSVTQTSTEGSLEYVVSFPIYCIAFMSFIGWILLVIFGGVGLSALPIDLIREFNMRPVLMSAKDAREKKSLISKKIVELIEVGKELKDESEYINGAKNLGWWAKRKVSKDYNYKENMLAVSLYELEKEFDIFELELKFSENSNKLLGPLEYVGKLILGIIFSLVSLAFWIHILVHCVLDKSPMLNKILTSLVDSQGALIATGLYAFFGLYLLWCAQKGNIKFGVRIPFVITLHPMKQNETWMNSFLFNVSTLLIASVAVTQFMVSAFDQYAKNTAIDSIINMQIQYLRWFSYFYQHKVFEIALLIWSGLTFLYLMIRRSDKPSELRELERLRNERNDRNKQ